MPEQCYGRGPQSTLVLILNFPVFTAVPHSQSLLLGCWLKSIAFQQYPGLYLFSHMLSGLQKLQSFQELPPLHSVVA